MSTDRSGGARGDVSPTGPARPAPGAGPDVHAGDHHAADHVERPVPPTGGAASPPSAGGPGLAPPAARKQRGARTRRARAGGVRSGQGRAGWLFVAPAIALLTIFVVLPVLLIFWVSLTDWSGRGSPLSSEVGFVGAANYDRVLTDGGLITRDFATSIRNTFYYVLGVVPAQTLLALFLAVVLNQQLLKARGFFRTAYYFPAVTSSVAITLVFLFLLSGGGAVNRILAVFGVDGPNWFTDSRGLLHMLGSALGVWDTRSPPAALTENTFFALSAWEWLSGPSVALTAIMILVTWTTTGTFMLMFLAALQDVPVEVEEAAMVDGANRWQRFRAVTLPHLRPTLILVITLGLIGTWQVFDQVFLATQGGPAKTTITPAYLSYTYAFDTLDWGVAAAIAFLLFAIIIVFTLLQRLVFRGGGNR
jgi:multiple sugar transport system permease protein